MHALPRGNKLGDEDDAAHQARARPAEGFGFAGRNWRHDRHYAGDDDLWFGRRSGLAHQELREEVSAGTGSLYQTHESEWVGRDKGCAGDGVNGDSLETGRIPPKTKPTCAFPGAELPSVKKYKCQQ